jgi:hypothetical protein
MELVLYFIAGVAQVLGTKKDLACLEVLPLSVYLGTRWGWVVNTTPRPPLPTERPGTNCTGGWVGLGAGLDSCGKSRSHRDSIPGPSFP